MKHAFRAASFALAGLLATAVHAQEPVSTEGPQASSAAAGRPVELRLTRAHSTSIDLRNLPATPPLRRDRPEREPPEIEPVALPGGPSDTGAALPTIPAAPAPSPMSNFLGLDFNNWGSGRPPDTVGDVGPTYYIQAVNASIGIYRKSDSVRVAAFTFNTFMSQGAFGNLCDTANFGDPVILYDTFEDRWVITDFAFQLDGGGNVVNPPGAFQCFAVSQTGDPVSGGWNFYSIQLTDGLNDYPKFGIWPDAIYMSANMFGFPAGGAFLGTRVWALNKAQMYAGDPNIQVIEFNPPAAEFTLLPANARLQTGTPPTGSPNYFSVVQQYTNAISVYKFHVDWTSISLSSFTGPFLTLAPASWASPPSTVPAMGGNANDTLGVRLMMQNQYTNIGGVESLWNTHTVLGGAPSTAAPRYYQVNVTGGTVAANTTQAATHTPDTTVNRYMPSLAVDRAGDMAIGYSASSSTLMPAIRYAGRLAGDPLNTLPQTETSLVEGTGAQNTSNRWGDYSAMSLDPDGCTFWFTTEYYITTGGNWQTRVGSFAFPSCTPVSTGSLQGTVTAALGGAPIGGATVKLGSRTATTNASGVYVFSALPSGNYPSVIVSKPGFVSASATGLAVNDGTTTIQNFSLGAAPASACLTDTTQADFQAGVFANLDVTTSPGDVTLNNTPALDQQNTTLGNSGVGITTTTWGGQTFTPAVSGQLARADINLFCAGCTGTTPNLTLSLRATSAGLPSGADLATATVTGFNSGSSAYYTANFGAPPSLVAGTTYALVIRPTANPSPGTYALTRSGTSTTGANVYAGGARVTGAASGTVWSTPLTGGVSTDAGFRTYMNIGYQASGNLASSTKDSNLPVAQSPVWTNLTWNASTPASTGLQFQVAASNASTGPFNFVGPDGTASTFYATSGGSLSQFNGNRYLKYRADLSTGNSAATPTLNDVTVCYGAPTPADVAISKTDGVATAVPGGSVTYTITASNPSATAASGATVADTFPASLTCTWICSASGGGTCAVSGSGNINDTVDLPSGASATYSAICNIAASATGSLINTATITSSGDPNTADNSATDTDTLTPNADLAVTKTDGVTTATPGGSTTYTITASNAGPSNVTGATVADTFPAALTCTWTCTGSGGGSCTASGSGNINDSVNLPGGGSVTYTAACAISPAASGSLVNAATVAAPGGVTDPTPGNNSATDTDTLSASADLSISKTDFVATATPGGAASYTIIVSNAGPSAVLGALVSDTVASSLSQCNWGCSATGGGTCNASGSGNIVDVVDLPVGATLTYALGCTIAESATGSLSNTATVAAPGGVSDPLPGNNSATDVDTLVPAADLSVTKTDGVTSAAPGGSVTYSIFAANNGLSDSPGSTVTDTFPPSLTCSWTCVAADGATCTPSGSGNIGDTVNLPAGGSVIYTAGCTLASNAIGSLSNTATVAPGAGVTDPAPGNNSATDTDTIIESADLSISKTDGVTTATPGDSTTYTITASNAGPSNVTGATVADTFPAALTCTWTCTGSGGGTCAASGSGNINGAVNLPSGGSATYTANCAISPTAAGSLSNTATISAPGGVDDPVSANNSANDTDSLDASADLSITKTDFVSTATPGGGTSYTIVVSNAGPSAVLGALVSDAVPPSLSPCTWGCVATGGGNCDASGTGDILDVVNIPVGGTLTYGLSCTIADSATGSLSNTATVEAPDGVSDPAPGNNSATDSDTLIASADLSISKTDGATTATPGGSTTYTITASNAGPSSVTGATVADTFPAALSCAWTCTGSGGGSCTASGSGNINGAVNLPGGGSVTYTAACAISPAASGSLVNTATVAAPGGVTDPTPGNNSATDSDTLAGAADLAVTVTDNEDYVQVGDSLDYLIEVTNPSGPSNAVASVSDVLPAVLGGGSWVCSGTGGASCGSPNGSGNTLSDTANVPVGGKAAYLFSATLQSVDLTDRVANTASATLTNGSDPTPANNAATDTDIVVIYRDGFDPGSLSIASVVGSGSDYVTAQMRIDADLLGQLGMVPVSVASGQNADGRTLFTVQLARFGADYALRILSPDDAGLAEHSLWTGLDTRSPLLAFAWQSASDQVADGYLDIEGTASPLIIRGRDDRGRLTHLLIRIENSVPWLTLIMH